MRKKEIGSKRRGASMVVAMAAAICCVGMSMVACGSKGGGGTGGGGETQSDVVYEHTHGEIDKLTADYKTEDQLLKAGADVNREIAGEGFVLLKNENNTLPLKKEGAKVTVLGESADNLAYGGSGSGGQNRPGNTSTPTTLVSEKYATLYESLDEAGIKYNPSVKGLYDDEKLDQKQYSKGGFFGRAYTYNAAKYMNQDVSGSVTFGAQKYSDSTDCCLKSAESTYSEYGDAAIVVISRSGGEGFDNASSDVLGHADKTEHYLTLNDSEREMMAYAKSKFNKVVVLINSPVVMELKDIQDDDKIGGVLWIGQPGWNGIMAVGDILTGKVNPSGHTVDLWMSDFKTDPTWYNFGDYTHLTTQTGTHKETVTEWGQSKEVDVVDYAAKNVSFDAAPTIDKDVNSELTYTNKYYGLDYAEGIYMGYRYYETVAAELGDAGDTWYKNAVTYPFGYGLSYTTFTKSIKNIEGDLSKADGKIKVTVTVKNTGSVAGKDVVQIYDSAPYTKGGIEKAACDLVGFTKTPLIQPNEEKDVVVEFNVKDMAAFDYNDKNQNKNNGYELEVGEYKISLRENSHAVIEEKTLNRSGSALTWDEDGNPTTPNNIFSQESGTYEASNTLANHWTADDTDHYLTRDKLVSSGAPTDLKKLSWIIEEDGNQLNDKAINYIKNWGETTEKSAAGVDRDFDNLLTASAETDYKNNWTKTADDVKNYKQGTGVKDSLGFYKLTIEDMLGVPYGDAKWDEFIDQLTFDELKTITANGSFSTQGLSTIDTQTVVDNDGPGQLKQSGTATASGYAYVCEVVVASTWNTDLAEKQGRIIGNEGLLNGQTGWYGPGINTHRNPLGGRNFEYYSQDGLQGGKIAAANIKGATEKGIHVYMKHAFMNDQETSRCDGLATFVTEQALRQIYAKPLEIVMKEGGGNGTMTAFNFVGIDNTASYTITTQLYTNEWGYHGSSVTDMYGEGQYAQSNPWTIVRGMTIPLGSSTVYQNATWDNNQVKVNGKESPTLWYWARETAHRVLYNMANDDSVVALQFGYSPTKVSNSIEYNAALESVKVGDAMSGKILTEAAIAKLDELLGKDNYTVSLTGIPGVTSAEDGTLSGTVQQPMGWFGPTQLPSRESASIRIALKDKTFVWFAKTFTCTINAAE